MDILGFEAWEVYRFIAFVFGLFLSIYLIYKEAKSE